MPPPHTETSLRSFVKAGQTPKKPKGKKTKGTTGTNSHWMTYSETGYTMDMMQDQDWALCDKDCGWCGHCAESYDY